MGKQILVGMLVLLFVVLIVFIAFWVIHIRKTRVHYHKVEMRNNGGANVDSGVYTNEGFGFMHNDDMDTLLADNNRDLVRLRLVDIDKNINYGERQMMGPISIGSEYGDSTLKMLGDHSVSRNHCVLFCQNGVPYVRDTNSKNGTFLNEIPVKTDMILHTGDVIRVGHTRLAVTVI